MASNGNMIQYRGDGYSFPPFMFLSSSNMMSVPMIWISNHSWKVTYDTALPFSLMLPFSFDDCSISINGDEPVSLRGVEYPFVDEGTFFCVNHLKGIPLQFSQWTCSTFSKLNTVQVYNRNITYSVKVENGSKEKVSPEQELILV